MSAMNRLSTRTATARSAAISPAPTSAICRRRMNCWACVLRLMHNLYFYNHLMERIREALDNGTFQQFHDTYVHKLDTRI